MRENRMEKDVNPLEGIEERILQKIALALAPKDIEKGQDQNQDQR